MLASDRLAVRITALECTTRLYAARIASSTRTYPENPRSKEVLETATAFEDWLLRSPEECDG